MRFQSKMLVAAILATGFVSPAFAGPVGVTRTSSYVVQPNPGTIARLQEAADKSQRDGLNGNKNKLEFRRKNYQIRQVIAKLENGQPVFESELDQALTPAHVW